MNSVPYIVITPARNEEDNLGHTIRSMIAQTLRPVRWVIVNDGSSDRTGEIAEAAAKEHDWIEVVHVPDRGFRKSGGGVVEAFYIGYERVRELPWVYLVKFDADLSFAPDFFERCLSKFHAQSDLGIGGGLICRDDNGKLVCESPGDPAFHVRGATKIYRRQCWDALGELPRSAGWDTLDELKANMLGWKTRSFRDIPLCHHRQTGSADGNWKNYTKFGLGSYIVGYHPLFMFCKCIKRGLQKPYLLGAIALWWGFCKGYLGRVDRVKDSDVIRYLRAQQLKALMLRPSLWTR